MPRIRAIKHEYFTNEDLAQASRDARLLGIGLTTLADRFPRLAVLLDATAERERRRVVRQLSPLRVLAPRLPAGAGDPGELSAAQATQLCLELLAK